MTKKISDKLILGNSLISTKKECLTKTQVYIYWYIVDSLLPEGYYTYGNNDSFSNFCKEYPFLVRRDKDTMMINCDKNLLERYCRMGVPTELTKVFDIAGTKLNEFLSKNSEQINYNDTNIEDLEKYLNEVKNEDKVWRMIENPGLPCDVKITEKSRRTLAKTLLK